MLTCYVWLTVSYLHALELIAPSDLRLNWKRTPMFNYDL
jgi:hypothetical protein